MRWVLAAALAMGFARASPVLAQATMIVMPKLPAQTFKPFVVKSSYAQGSRPAEGLGLLAVNGGRSMDLTSPDTWTSGPRSGGADTDVGVGWRRNNLSVVVGYVRPGSAPTDITTEDGSRFKGRSMMGLGFSLHY